MNYKEWKGLDKKASPITSLISGFGALGSGVGQNAAVLLLAAAAGVGGLGGYLTAKLNAHDTQDIDTIQKEYENERLKSDLGYLTAKTKYEYEQQKNRKQPKAMRMFA